MECPSRTVNRYVIKKTQDKPSQMRSEQVIHSSLEGGRRVGESEGHYQKFIVARMCVKSGFVDVVGCHPDLVIS